MQANEELKQSLQKLVERFSSLTAKHFQELKPIGEALTEITPADEKDTETFLRNLQGLSAAVISVRKKTDKSSPVKDLPIPPYDLFLPFRSATAQKESASLAEAIGILNDTVQQLSNHWAPFAAVSLATTQTLSNPDLQLLRGRIMGQFEKSSELTGFDLFEPTRKASFDLFERKILNPVMSADDFKLFITSLNMVFWEGLPNLVREWQPGKDLPFALTQPTLAVIKGEAFRHMRHLRNKSSHDDPDAQRELAPIYQSLIGVRSLTRDDSELWLKLQIAVLENLASALDELSRTLELSKRSGGN
jgi:hypothetical protein